MKNIVFLGSIGIARKCLEEILNNTDVNLVGVCCSDLANWRVDNEISVYNYCLVNHLNIIKLSDIPLLDVDIGFSVRYHKIIPKEIVSSVREGIINTHGGILPQYRGVYSNIHSIINKEHEFGVTLHYISEGVDEGDIIEIRKIAIDEKDTGLTLYLKSETMCYEIVKDNLDKIISGNIQRIRQQDLIDKGIKSNVYYKSSTLRLKEIDLPDFIANADDVISVIRAFDSPYHEPAHITINGNKIYLRVNF